MSFSVPVTMRAVRRRVVHHVSEREVGTGRQECRESVAERSEAAKGLRGAHGDTMDGRQTGADAGVLCRDDCGAKASGSMSGRGGVCRHRESYGGAVYMRRRPCTGGAWVEG